MKVVPDWVWDLLCKAKQRLRERLPTIEFYCAYYGTLRAIFFAEDLPKLKDLPQLRIIEPFKAAHVVSNLYYDPEFDILFLIKETNVPHLYALHSPERIHGCRRSRVHSGSPTRSY